MSEANTLTRAIVGLFLLLVLFSAAYMVYDNQYSEEVYPEAGGDTWCASGWGNRTDININNIGGSALTNYQVYVNLSSNPINETSLRVYNITSCALRPHWCENSTGGNCYALWINHSAIAASSWINDTSIYYNHTTANSVSNGNLTFPFFDSFLGSSLDITKWNYSGAISVTNSEVTLNEDDIIVAKTKFGFGYAIHAKTKVDEQDCGFVALRETKDNENNGNTVANSDSSYPDDFNRFALFSQKAGSTHVSYQENWYDFRDTYYVYRIKRISGTEVIYEQETNSWTQTDSSYNPIVDLGACLRVWDSSQASTLISDWIFIRKYVSTDPQTNLGTDEPYIDTYHICGYVKSASGIGIENAYVSNNLTAATNYTNASGYYILSVLVNATYNVSASKVSYITNSTIVTIAGANMSNQNITLNVPVCYKPATPTNLQNTTGSGWINWTWAAGSGNITDTYNVSVSGNDWLNGTANTFHNKTNLCTNQQVTISVYAFNTSGNGNISDSNVTDTQSTGEALSWTDTNYSHRAVACIQNITTEPYQINFSLHTGTGTNNATNLFMNNHNETSDYSDIRVYNTTGNALSYWIEDTSIDPTKIWINTTETGSIQIYYGNMSASASSNGTNTFEFFDDFDGVPSSFNRISNSALWSGGAPNDWVGRPCLENRSGTWIATYVQGISHTDCSANELHIRFSTDEGATWTTEDNFTDNSTVSGFPISGHLTNYGCGEAILITAPNNNLIILSMESKNFGTGGAANMNGVWQYNSTDGGKTWTDEGRVFENSSIAIADYAIIGTDIYITVEYDPDGDYSTPVSSKLYNSSNNGTSWAFVSNITTLSESPPCNAYPETAIEYCGSNTILTVVRAATFYSKTLQRVSSDMGESWGTLDDITSSVGLCLGRAQMRTLIEEPDRIYLYGRDQVGTAYYIGLYYTIDCGGNWSTRFRPDPSSYTDSGYCSMLKRSNGTYYMLYYAGTKDACSVREAIFEGVYSIDSNKWDSYIASPASISIANSEVTFHTVSNSGQYYAAVLSKASFSIDKALRTKCKFNMVDNFAKRAAVIGFGPNEDTTLFYLGTQTTGNDSIMFTDTVSGDTNWYARFHSDGNDTDLGVVESISTTFKTFEIQRFNTNKSRWLINDSEVIGENITVSGSIPLALGIDSQTAVGETFDFISDWILIHEYALPEPSIILGTEEEGPSQFEQLVKTGKWQYIANVNATAQYPWQLNTTLGLNVSCITIWNEIGQRWNTTWMADWNNTVLAQVGAGDGCFVYFSQDDTITRDECAGGLNWSFPATGYYLTGLDYNGIRNLSQVNASIASTNMNEIEYTNETGSKWTYVYGSATNGTIEVKQGQAFWVHTLGTIEKVRTW